MSSPTESRNAEKQSEEVISSEAMEVEETYNEVEPNKNAHVKQQDDPTTSDEAAAAVKEAIEEAEGTASKKENNTKKDEAPQVEQSLQHVLYPGGTFE